ncbi:MAG TPA: hypothetical protein VKR32_16225 [Puia sp.]|nr:hypothetical protein [Puia sp.]
MRFNPSFQRVIFGITSVPLFCMLTPACHNYFKATPKDKFEVAQSYNTPAYENRYFILRNGSSAYYMNNMLVSDDKRTITCILDTLPYNHTLYSRMGNSGNMRYKPFQPGAEVLNEVHIYIPMDTSAHLSASFSLPVEKIQKVEVIEKDKGRTTSSYVVGAVGITAGILAVVVIIVLATKSSCPFISAYDGKALRLQGEVYGGAIYPQLCRNDYLKLDMAPTPSGRLQLQISNELKEKQFTDLAELIVATHDKNVTVVADENGALHTLSNPVLPFSATVANKNVLPLVTGQNDNLSFNFDDTAAAKEKNNQLDLVFNRPPGKTSAKLVLRLKNSYWLDMVYGKIAQGFGRYYPTYIKKQRSTPVEKLEQWKIDQQLPLQISLETKDGWKTQRNLNFTGPVASREIAIPVDLTKCASDKINLKLSSGFMFWEIDYAALDFSNDECISVSRKLPILAKDESGRDVTQVLSKDDDIFLEQPEIGNATLIDYSYSPTKDTSKTQTYFLHAKGYYEHIRNFTNAPNISFLRIFKQPGAMSDFSLMLYREAMNTNINSLVKK